jgi:hypothetical protein
MAVGFAADHAFGQSAWGFREVPQRGYGPSVVVQNYFFPGYGYGYGDRRGGYGGGFYDGDSHTEAVRRIQATHSRSRYYTHPRSLINAPPRLDYDPRWYGY